MSKSNQQSYIITRLKQAMQMYYYLQNEIQSVQLKYMGRLDALSAKPLDEFSTEEQLEQATALRVLDTEYMIFQNEIGQVGMKIPTLYNLLKSAGFKFDKSTFEQSDVMFMAELSKIVASKYELIYRINGGVVETQYKNPDYLDPEKASTQFKQKLNTETGELGTDVEMLRNFLENLTTTHIQQKEMARVQREQFEQNQKAAEAKEIVEKGI